MKVLPSRKNLWSAASVSSTAATAAFCAFSFSAAVGVAGADLARILREVQRPVGRAHDVGIERADDIEHRAVDHRPLFRIGRIELVEMMLVREILHDRAALPHHSFRQAGRFHHRRQMGRVLGQKVVGASLAIDVVLGEIELGRAYEHARGHVVDARLDDMELDRRHWASSWLRFDYLLFEWASAGSVRRYGSLGDRSADRLLVDDSTRLSIASARWTSMIARSPRATLRL